MSELPERFAAIRDRVVAEEAEGATTEVAPFSVECFADENKIVMKGHSGVFDQLSEDRGGYRIRIARGSFRKVLAEDPDVKLLYNHDPSLLLARTTVKEGPGMLRLEEDPKGLSMYAELVPTSLAKDLQQLIRYGVVNQQSFTHLPSTATDTWTEEESGLVRTYEAFGDLLDVGPVTFPAFEHAEVSMYQADGEVDAEALRSLAWKIHRGEHEATEEERAALDRAFSHTQTVSPWIAERALRAACQEPELLAAIPGKKLTMVDDEESAGEPAYRLAALDRTLALNGKRL